MALSSAVGGEVSIYRDRARRLGLPFARTVRLGPDVTVDVEAVRRGTFALSAADDRIGYLAPDEETMARIAGWLVTHRSARRRLAVATPSAIRSGLIESGKAAFVKRAIRRLAALHPELSARRAISPRQAAVGLVLAVVTALMFLSAPLATLIALNLVGALFFFGVSALRFVAAGLAGRRRLVRSASSAAPAAPPTLPTYTVLVPLYREAGIVGELVAALDLIDWPGIR